MPQVINGVGTWYWGRTNIRTRRGVCEFCKRTANLSSFDTTKFFVVLFVPLVPLGQKRIINQCSSCKRHLVLSLRKFNELRDREVGEAIQDYLAAPTDPARAEKAIGKCIGCEAQEQFFEVAEPIERSQARKAAVQARLGGAYAFFGFPEPAEAAYVRSHTLSPDAEVGDMLALLYLRQGRPDEAQWLTSQQHADPDVVCDVSLLPEQKRLVLLAMGLSDPTHRSRYFKAAAPFNFGRTFPYWTIKKILDTAPASR